MKNVFKYRSLLPLEVELAMMRAFHSNTPGARRDVPRFTRTYKPNGLKERVRRMRQIEKRWHR